MRFFLILIIAVSLAACGNVTTKKLSVGDKDILSDSDNTVLGDSDDITTGDTDGTAAKDDDSVKPQDSDKVNSDNEKPDEFQDIPFQDKDIIGQDKDTVEPPDSDIMPSCADGDTRCNNNMVQTCDAGVFKNIENCAPQGKECVEGFNGAVCVALPDDADTFLPEADTNDADSFVPDTYDADTYIAPDNYDADHYDADTRDNDTAAPDNDTAAPCGSVSLDGTNSYIDVPSNNSLGLTGTEWTIEAWVKLAVAGVSQPLVRKATSTTTTNPPYYFYALGSGGTAAYGGYTYDTSGNYYSATGSTITSGVWHHLAFVKTSSTLTMFIDGQPGTQASVSGNTVASTDTLVFGAKLTSSGNTYFSGLIDEIRISSVARYSSNFTPVTRLASDSSTIGLWHFEDGSGTVAADSRSGYNGTLHGSAAFVNDCAGK